jgi:uncharacterized protein (TIGR02300 family)
VAKPELGTKRLCGECGAKFYDLNKDPITCPKCGSVFEVAAVAPRGGRTEAVARAPVPVAADEEPEAEAAEFVSLEEADAETSGAKTPAEGAEAEEDVEMDESLDDAAFIEETEEGEEDVSDIIGDVENEEET